ncbi:uncharacterized protein LOC127839515 [Dreissena polymorpha]|uniref:uncharacterized protein LOC127839515 n=1 Tax=Dreissena polymorpha TaxID=45954 RepID=UPI002263F5B5|nr:uncharacterized protein LOC127839515 [Dreissena polymorpha]
MAAYPVKYPVKSSLKYRLYSPTAMTNAFRAVKEQQMSVCRASIQFGVPTTSLRQRVRGRVDPEVISSGPSPVLSQEEEAMFVDHLKFMASVGYGYTRMEVVNMASEYAVCLHKRDKEHPFSMKWFESFMKRWPELNVSKPRALSLARAKATSQEVVTTYFKELENVLHKHSLMDKPQHIYNVEEKGLQTENSPPFVVGCRETTTPAITSARTATTTVIGCGNALGAQIPPYFVFKGERMREELLEGRTPGAEGTVTPTGWSNREVFESYLQNHFLKYVQGRDKDQPILVLYDGHKSHISLPLINWAKEHNIILFVLPAHTSHILQPLNVGCFGPYQRIFNSECHKFMRHNPSSRITRYNICSLACKAYTHALSPDNFKSAFQKSGIFPFNPTAVDSAHFKPATVYKSKGPSPCNAEPIELHDVQELTVNGSDTCQRDFFVKKMDCIQMKSVDSIKQRRDLSTIVGGKAITEEITVKKIEEHHKNVNLSTDQAKIVKKNPTINKKRKVSATITEKLYKIPKVSKLQDNPNPGQSGLQILPVSDCSDFSLTDDEDDEKCCVCGRFEPIELTNCVSLIFTKWAQCDVEKCGHWTHLQFCCPQRVVRRGDRFCCPCHMAVEE